MNELNFFISLIYVILVHHNDKIVSAQEITNILSRSNTGILNCRIYKELNEEIHHLEKILTGLKTECHEEFNRFSQTILEYSEEAQKSQSCVKKSYRESERRKIYLKALTVRILEYCTKRRNDLTTTTKAFTTTGPYQDLTTTTKESTTGPYQDLTTTTKESTTTTGHYPDLTTTAKEWTTTGPYPDLTTTTKESTTTRHYPDLPTTAKEWTTTGRYPDVTTTIKEWTTTTPYSELTTTIKEWTTTGPSSDLTTTAKEWTTTGPNSGSSCSGTLYQGRCYTLSATQKSWDNAKIDCQANGGHLVDITSSDENDIMKQIAKLSPFDQVWLGATDQTEEGVYRWTSNNQILTYTDWYGSDPDGGSGQNCLSTYKDERQWIDNNCVANLFYICEK